MLHFVVPIRHPLRVRDPALQYSMLEQTLRSIGAQLGRDCCATIVANRGQVLPPIGEGFRVEHVDLEPALDVDLARTREEFYAAVQRDKGRRVLAAARRLRADDYLMVVDDDDLLSCSIARHVNANPGGAGWYVRDGYSWDGASAQFAPLPQFNKVCGSSLVVRAGLYRYFACRQGKVNINAIRELGSHVLIFNKLQKSAEPLLPLPFAAAIYRRRSINSTRREIVDRQLRPAAFASPDTPNAGASAGRAPQRTAAIPISPQICTEFFGGRCFP